MSLSCDTARCAGIPNAGLCWECQRRTSPGDPLRQVQCAPELSQGLCHNYIAPKEAK